MEPLLDGLDSNIVAEDLSSVVTTDEPIDALVKVDELDAVKKSDMALDETEINSDIQLPLDGLKEWTPEVSVTPLLIIECLCDNNTLL